MTTLPEPFLRRQRHRSNGVFLAWGMAGVFLAGAWDGAVHLQWVPASRLWALVPTIVAGGLLVRWLDRAWRLGNAGLARECDARWNLQGRLESLVEMAGSDSPVATAQRAETARRIASLKPVGTATWLCGIGAMLVAALILGIEGLAFVRRHRATGATLSAAAPLTRRVAEQPSEGRPPTAPLPPPAPTSLKLNLTANVQPASGTRVAAGPFKLPDRATTPAGRLETLAQRQREITRTLQEKKTSATIGEKPTSARQASLARNAADLAREHGLSQLPQNHLEGAVKTSAAAARQLGLGDQAAAREPALETRQALDAAVEAQEREGRADANVLLQQVRDLLAHANPTTQAAAVATARQELRAEALRQQQQGSAAAAQQLADLAGKLGATPSSGGQKTAGSGSYPSANPPGQTSPDRSGAESTSASDQSAGRPGGSGSGSGSASSGSPSDSGGAGAASGGGQPGGTGSVAIVPGTHQDGPAPGGPGASPENASGSGSGSNSRSGQTDGAAAQPGTSPSSGPGAVDDRAAAQVAETQAKLSPETTLSHAIGELGGGAPGDGGHGNLVRLSEALTDLRVSVQQITLLPHQAELLGIASSLEARLKGHSDDTPLSDGEMRDLLSQARRLANALEAEKAGSSRDEWIRGFRPEDIDPDYRKAVQNYFEALSREGTTR